jgi:iron-sulfur cluster repair protein YtfE (RIC family)
MKTTVPRTLAEEHVGIRRQLAHLVEEGGRTGEAARALARILLPHMDREDRLVFPALAILEGLARRTEEPDPAAVLRHHDDLKTALPGLLRDHGFIVGALEKLEATARAEHKEAVVDLSRRLIGHARLEEEILYPAAVLAGEYVRVTTVG